MAALETTAAGDSEGAAGDRTRNATDRVLIVEDDPTAAMLLARALRRHAYEVETAASVQQALERGALCHLTTALVDLRLEHRDAPMVERILRAFELDVRVTAANVAAVIATIEGRSGRVELR